MLFTTPLQVLVLAVVLLGGWLLGYASAPDAKKWRRRVREQSDSFTAYHGDAEDKLRAAQQRAADLNAENAALRADHADAERTIVALRAAAVAPEPVAPAVAVPEPVAPDSVPAVHAEPQPKPSIIERAPLHAEAAPVARSIEPFAAPTPAHPDTDLVEEQSETAAAFTTDAPAAPVIAREPFAPREDAAVAPEGAPASAGDTFHAAPDLAPAPDAAVEAEPEAAATYATPPTPPTGGPPTAPPAAGVTAAAEFAIATAPPAPMPMTPQPSAAAPASIGAAEPAILSKGWFGSSTRDDLTRIDGIDDVLNTRLFGLGVVRFEDIEKLSDEDEMALEQRLGVPVGLVAREQWRAQASLLRDGLTEAHRARFGVETTRA